jgi:cysteine desulfurase
MPDLDIYLDNAATTRTEPDIAEAVARDMVVYYANPSSIHRPGLAAHRKLAEARRDVQARFKDRIAIFTASGSEAINLALKGAFLKHRKGANRILVSAVEHPAVMNGAKELAAIGAKPEVVPVNGEGIIDLKALEATLAVDDVAVVAVMHVQNELGTIEPVAEVGALVRKYAPKAHFLVDAVQGLGKVPVDPAGWQADTVAIASHKLHGPKGMGALLVRKGVALAPLVSGGGQEGGFRSGTENVAGAVGFATAIGRAIDGLAAHRERLQSLKMRFRERILGSMDGVVENGASDWARASPAILNLSFQGVPSEVLLHALEQDGIYVSAGSACHSKGKPKNHIHAAIKLPAWRSESAIRFGFSWHTAEWEIKRTAERLVERVAEIRKVAAPAHR